jgi:hypothetical protein
MSANRLSAQFVHPAAANLAEVLVMCASSAGIVVLVPAPLQQAAWQYQIYLLAQERARRALEPPRHHRLISNWN